MKAITFTCRYGRGPNTPSRVGNNLKVFGVRCTSFSLIRFFRFACGVCQRLSYISRLHKIVTRMYRCETVTDYHSTKGKNTCSVKTSSLPFQLPTVLLPLKDVMAKQKELTEQCPTCKSHNALAIIKNVNPGLARKISQCLRDFTHSKTQRRSPLKKTLMLPEK